MRNGRHSRSETLETPPANQGVPQDPPWWLLALIVGAWVGSAVVAWVLVSILVGLLARITLWGVTVGYQLGGGA